MRLIIGLGALKLEGLQGLLPESLIFWPNALSSCIEP